MMLHLQLRNFVTILVLVRRAQGGKCNDVSTDSFGQGYMQTSSYGMFSDINVNFRTQSSSF